MLVFQAYFTVVDYILSKIINAALVGIIMHVICTCIVWWLLTDDLATWIGCFISNRTFECLVHIQNELLNKKI